MAEAFFRAPLWTIGPLTGLSAQRKRIRPGAALRPLPRALRLWPRLSGSPRMPTVFDAATSLSPTVVVPVVHGHGVKILVRAHCDLRAFARVSLRSSGQFWDLDVVQLVDWSRIYVVRTGETLRVDVHPYGADDALCELLVDDHIVARARDLNLARCEVTVADTHDACKGP